MAALQGTNVKQRPASDVWEAEGPCNQWDPFKENTNSPNIQRNLKERENKTFLGFIMIYLLWNFIQARARFIAHESPRMPALLKTHNNFMSALTKHCRTATAKTTSASSRCSLCHIWKKYGRKKAEARRSQYEPVVMMMIWWYYDDMMIIW